TCRGCGSPATPPTSPPRSVPRPRPVRWPAPTSTPPWPPPIPTRPSPLHEPAPRDDAPDRPRSEIVEDPGGDLLAASRTSQVLRQDPRRGRGRDGAPDAGSRIREAQVLEHQGTAADGADRVGDAPPGDVGRTAVHRFEHRGRALLG